jgi:flagellar biosynthesis/type III secretory pathway protein FliH
MARTRYEPPRHGAAASADALRFDRIVPSEPIPWVLSGTAANGMPATIPEAELEALREAARAQGLADGRAQAEAELAAAHAELQAGIEAGLAELATWRRTTTEAYRRELAELAIAIAEAVLQRELQDGLGAIEALLEQAMHAIDPEERCTITVAPAAASATIAWASTNWPAALVRGDAELGLGELRVRSKSGTIDATLQARVDHVRRLVLGDGAR